MSTLFIGATPVNLEATGLKPELYFHPSTAAQFDAAVDAVYRAAGVREREVISSGSTAWVAFDTVVYTDSQQAPVKFIIFVPKEVAIPPADQPTLIEQVEDHLAARDVEF